jgi:hypothetical protein
MQIDTPILAAFLFNFPKANAADLFGVGHMGSTTWLQISRLIANTNTDQADLPTAARWLHGHSLYQIRPRVQFGIGDPFFSYVHVAGNQAVQVIF